MIYYLPFSYFWKSRAKTIFHRFSFFILILIPIFIFWSMMNSNIESSNIALIGFIGMFSVYEIGYLYNDFYTTKFEEHPSYWLVKKDRDFVDKNFEMIIAARVFVTTLCILCLKCIFNVNVLYYSLALVLLYIVYSFHNTIRNRWNILTDFCLQVLKYCSVLLLFGNIYVALKYSVAMIFAVPLIRSMEFTNKKRLNINIFNRIDVNLLRVLYHMTVFIISILLSQVLIECKTLALASLVLLIFRIFSFILLKNKKAETIRMKNFEGVE